MVDVLVIDGHPSGASLCAALANSHAEGVRAAGGSAQVLALRDLSFDPVLHGGYRGEQPLEPDLVRAQEAIAAARRLVVVTPIWWGATPALLKGFFDRTLERGWAFRYLPNGMPQGLLAGRTGRVIITSDSPGYYLKFIQGDPAAKALIRSTLKFCGVKPVDMTRIGPVHNASAEQCQRWVEQVREQGRADVARLPSNPPVPAPVRHRMAAGEPVTGR